MLLDSSHRIRKVSRQLESSGHSFKLFVTTLANTLSEFAVNGTGLPNVDFDVGESYAGSLPITENVNDTNQLFFWFFPSENQTVGKEITIWLTGGVSLFCASFASAHNQR